MTIALAIAASLFVAILAAVALAFSGYPPPSRPDGVLSGREQAILSASADAFFPRSTAIGVSGTEAGVIDYMSETMAELPPQPRLLLRLLLTFVELGPWLINQRPRLSRQPLQTRIATLRSWETSGVYLLRVVFTSLRTFVAMSYMANASVVRQIGARADARPFAAVGALS